MAECDSRKDGRKQGKFIGASSPPKISFMLKAETEGLIVPLVVILIVYLFPWILSDCLC